MDSIILIAIFIGVLILVIHLISKNDARSKSKSNSGKPRSQELTPKELSELNHEEFADYLLDKKAPNILSVNRIPGNNAKGNYDRNTKEVIAKIEFPSGIQGYF